MNASQQLNNWITNETGLLAVSQDEILKLVFEYPAVPSYKMILAKWQYLKFGEVEEGLWQQLLLQWPDPAQLFIWRSRSFDFNPVIPAKHVQPEDQLEHIYQTVEAIDTPESGVWNWKQYLDEMNVPVNFVWEMKELHSELEISASQNQVRHKTESTASSVGKIPLTDWKTYIDENLEHIGSVELVKVYSEPVDAATEFENEALVESISNGTKKQKSSSEILKKNDDFSTKSDAMDIHETYQPSTYVQWLQSKKKLSGVSNESPSKPVQKLQETRVKTSEEKPVKEPKRKKDAPKEKLKKKEKKKIKSKKKNKLEQEIYSSLEFNEEAASETYAALLAKQGHFELAERIYERLRLIYPEKSSYFAGLIKNLKS